MTKQEILDIKFIASNTNEEKEINECIKNCLELVTILSTEKEKNPVIDLANALAKLEISCQTMNEMYDCSSLTERGIELLIQKKLKDTIMTEN